MNTQKIVDYLIKNGDVYINHEGWLDEYYWSTNRDGYDLAFRIEQIRLKGQPDVTSQRLILTDLNAGKTYYYNITSSKGFVGNPDEFMAKLKHSGVLDGKC